MPIPAKIANPANWEGSCRGPAYEIPFPRPYDWVNGYPFEDKFHNIGYVASPYPGKVGQGDWGPVQSAYSAKTGIYWNPTNSTYPYPMYAKCYGPKPAFGMG